jgi:hypothetical protein
MSAQKAVFLIGLERIAFAVPGRVLRLLVHFGIRINWLDANTTPDQS